MGKQWKSIAIPGGKYEIDRNGIVRQKIKIMNGLLIRNSIKKTYINPKGFVCVWFWVNGEQLNKLVHRLVAGAFLPNPNKFPFVTFKDKSQTNTNVSNLQWVETDSIPRKRSLKTFSLTIKTVREIKAAIRHGVKNRLIAKQYKVSEGLISKIKTGKRWAHVN